MSHGIISYLHILSFLSKMRSQNLISDLNLISKSYISSQSHLKYIYQISISSHTRILISQSHIKNFSQISISSQSQFFWDEMRFEIEISSQTVSLKQCQLLSTTIGFIMSLFNSISTLSHHIKDMMWYKRTILIETCCNYRTLFMTSPVLNCRMFMFYK